MTEPGAGPRRTSVLEPGAWPSRRTLLRAGVLAGAVTAVGAPEVTLAADARPTAAAPRLRRNPFTLGVASGDPLPGGVVLWTRLALDPAADSGLGGMPERRVPVHWQVAKDRRFRHVVRRGVARATAASAHAVHVEVHGLQPGREYFYRFRTGRHHSPVGRTRTAPRPGELPGALAMAFVSCAQLEHGFFNAYRALAADHPDLVLHLGDYQYEYRAGAYTAPGGNVRTFRGPETVSLAGYRQRYGQYHADPDLQAAHAVSPWLVVFDDHEVDNNWAGAVPEHPDEAAGFLARRAAAFRAYYENMPLRRGSLPHGAGIQVYRRLQWGALANFHMLDTRQFRDDQACGDGFKDCAAADDPGRSLPGMAQEQWLAGGFAASTQRWDVIGQQVFFGRRDSTGTPDNTVSMDAWDGYRPSRDRVVRSWVDARVRNPIVLSGDVHAHWASDVLADFRDGSSPVVGSEFVTSSITSGGDGYDEPTGQHPWAKYNPNLRFWTNLRGYVNATVTPASFTADYRCVPTVRTPGAGAFTRARFVVDDGVRGMRKTGDAPLARASGSARLEAGPRILAPRTDAEKIRDTLAAESH